MQKSKPKLTLSAPVIDVPMDELEELMSDEELDARVDSKSRKAGRPKNPDRLCFKEAREFMHTQNIGSRGQYEKWFAREKPKTLPRFPYRVYTDEWVSWNDFLGNSNEFNEKIGTKWKPLLDVIPQIHKLQLSSQAEWLEYYRLNKDSPELASIPARPELVYNDWRSWGHWLGSRPVEAIKARQEAQRVQIYSITHYPGDPINVLYYGIDPSASTFRERMQDQQFTVVRTYWYDGTHADQITRIVEAFSSSYMDQQRQRITPNVYDILWHLDQILDPVLRGQV